MDTINKQTIAEFIKIKIQEQGLKKIYVADNIGVNYKTFLGRVDNNNLTAEDIIKLIRLLNLKLEELEQLDLEDRKRKSQ